MEPLTESQIYDISQILSDDSGAGNMRENIYGGLGLPSGSLEDMKRKVLSDGSGSYGFFLQALLKFKSSRGSKATMNYLINYFTKLNLTSVVEAIVNSRILITENTVSELYFRNDLEHHTFNNSILGMKYNEAKALHSSESYSKSSEILNSRTLIGNVSEPESSWFAVEHPVESFTGREDELSKLHELLTRSNKTPTVKNQITVLSGLGAVGKSQLAKKYAILYSADYEENAIWIDAETQGSFRNSIAKLLKNKFHISEEDSHKKTDTELLEIIYDWCSTRKCLIIFDNVEDFDVMELLPKSRNPNSQIPTVLITSRQLKWGKKLSLHVLSEKEALKFIQENNISVCRETEETVLKLVNALSFLPLALQQAVSYINVVLSEDENPIQKYLCLFESPKIIDLLSHLDKLSYYDRITFTTWNVTMENIQTEKYGLLAVRIMDIISCFEPNNIPTRIFWDQQSSQAISENEDEVKAAVILLKKYSMVSGQPEEINVHRLVQLVIRLNIDTIIESVLKEGLELLKIYMHPSTKNDDLVKFLVPHAESVWRHAMEYSSLFEDYEYFPMYVCRKLGYYGRFTAMLQLARDSTSKIQSLPEKHKWTILIKYSEAEALYRQKEYAKSLEILNEIHSISKKEFGSDRTLTLSISNLLALNLGGQGKYSEQLWMHEDILEIQLVKFGTEHKETLPALHNKATALANLGRHDESLELLNKVYEINKRVLGKEDSRTLTTMSWRANVCMKKEKWEEAKEDFKAVYDARKLLLGLDHPDTLQTLEDLQLCETKLVQSKTLKSQSVSKMKRRWNSCLELEQSRSFSGTETKATVRVRCRSLTLINTHPRRS